MRITFVISSISSGGAERVMSMMSNYWARKGWNITIITYATREADFYNIHSHVERIRIHSDNQKRGFLSPVISNISRIYFLRKEIIRSRPDVIISFMDTVNVLTLIATVFLNYPILISERVDPRYHLPKLPWRILRRIFYSRASGLIVQTSNLLKWASVRVGTKKSFVIPNPIDQIVSNSTNNTSKFSHSYIVAVGRIETQKGFDILIRIFDRVLKSHPDWKLVIVGEGTKRQSLELLITSLGLTEKVLLIGRITDPSEVMRNASVFALSSRFEGFPNVLIEAMKLGLPVISYDCPSGPAEIINHRKNGILIPMDNEIEFEKSLVELMDDRNFAESLGKEAKKVILTYSEDKIFGMWENIIKLILKQNHTL